MRERGQVAHMASIIFFYVFVYIKKMGERCLFFSPNFFPFLNSLSPSRKSLSLSLSRVAKARRAAAARGQARGQGAARAAAAAAAAG